MNEYLIDDRLHNEIYEKIKNMSDEEFEQFLKNNKTDK